MRHELLHYSHQHQSEDRVCGSNQNRPQTPALSTQQDKTPTKEQTHTKRTEPAPKGEMPEADTLGQRWEGGVVLVQWDLWGPTSSLFSPFRLNLGLQVVILECQEHVPVLPNSTSSTLLWPGLPISHHLLLPPRPGEKSRSECMRLRENQAGKAQARGRYRRGIRGRSNPSPSGCTYLHGKSRMKSQLRQLGWGGGEGKVEATFLSVVKGLGS